MQTIAILSINHHQAPVAVREKVAFATNTLRDKLHELMAVDGIKACAILSTCNRAEIIAITDVGNSKQILSDYLSRTHQIAPTAISPYLNYINNDEALNHICKVATGLNSLLFGEPQILGQLKNAYHLAKQAGTLNKLLEKLFQHAFSTAKKVRTDTKIGASPISVAYCALRLSENIFTDLSSQTVLLIGAGEMIELCAQHLQQKGVKRMIVANRTLKNAEKIATAINAQSISLKELSSIIHQADIIISSTAASVPIIGKGLIETTLKLRKHKPIFILDIAVPRDIEPEVMQLGDVFLYTLDDLQQVVDENIGSRQKDKSLAEDIIKAENKKFNNWRLSLPNEIVVQNYQHNAYDLKTTSIANALKKLNNGGEAASIIEELADQLTNKLLHMPFKNIKKVPTEQLQYCKNCVPDIAKKQ